MIQEEDVLKLTEEDEDDELGAGVSDESLDEVLDEEDDEDLEEGSGDEFGDDGKEELGAW